MDSSKPSMMDFAGLANTFVPYSFNTVNKPEWFNGTYNWTQIRPMGATALHPEGLQAAYNSGMNQNSLGGLLSLFRNKITGA